MAKRSPAAATRGAAPAEADVAVLVTRELYETTRDICGRLDLEEALQAIVRRARTLLGGDMAYLATCDDDHQVLRMRSFDNVMTDRFRALVVPYGVGVGGAVASQRRPLSVEDYFDASNLEHSAEIDEAAAGEGICGGVAAPVEFESRLLAILFVATRTPYRFTEQQVTMLSSLANAAAIAINNAQVHGRLVAAMDIHQKLMALALAERGPAALARALTELISGPALFLDWRGEPIAHADHQGTSLPIPDARTLQDLFTVDAPADVIGVPIRIGGTIEGYLMAAPGDTDAELATVAIEQTVTALALELMKMRSAEQVELRLRGGVFSELLNHPPADEQRLLRQADQLGCDLRAPHLVAVLQFRGQEAGNASQPWQRLIGIMTAACREAGLSTLLVDRGSAVAMLVEASDAGAALGAIQRGLDQARRADLPEVVAGVGNVAPTLEAYASSFAEATRSVDVAGRLASLGGVVHFADLGFHQVLLGARPTADLAAMARRVLGPLTTSDAQRGTKLVETVRVFLDANGNVEAIARRMGLHPNTVRGRIARINALLGLELEDARTRLDLHLALETMTLAGEVDQLEVEVPT